MTEQADDILRAALDAASSSVTEAMKGRRQVTIPHISKAVAEVLKPLVRDHDLRLALADCLTRATFERLTTDLEAMLQQAKAIKTVEADDRRRG